MKNNTFFTLNLMKNTTLGEFNRIDDFVDDKIRKFDNSEHSFRTMFELMFSEKSNVLYERIKGVRIEKITYGEAYETIKKVSFVLSKMLKDLPQDCAVGIYMDNSLEWIETFWAVLLCGYSPLLMNLRLSDVLLQKTLESADCKVVIFDKREMGEVAISWKQIEERLQDTSDQKDEIDATAEKKAASFGTQVLVMSSGTSFNVKVCAYTAEEFYYQIKDSYQIIKDCTLMKKHYEGQLKQLTFLPFYHVFGLIAMYVWFGFFSRTFVQLNDFAPQTITNAIKRHNVTHIFAVPMFWNKVYEQAMVTIKGKGEETYQKFLKGMKIYDSLKGMPALARAFSKMAFKEVRQNMFGESISFLITGGSEIKPEVMNFFNAIGYHLADGYGMTEIGITSVELSNNPKILSDCFVGKPLSSLEYKINDEGELLVRGKSTAKYIIENGEKRENSDWFNTHDLAECIDGHYRILGRKDDLVITANGENLNPNLVESMIDVRGINGVCLIKSIVDKEEIPTLLVSLDKYISEARLLRISEEIKQCLSKNNLSSQIGRVYFTSDALMKEDEFKLNRKRISEDFAKGEFAETKALEKMEMDCPDNEIVKHLKELFATSLGRDADSIGFEMDFFLDGGGTSIEYLAMISQIQEDYKVSFPTNAQGGMNCIKGIYEFLEVALNVD